MASSRGGGKGGVRRGRAAAADRRSRSFADGVLALVGERPDRDLGEASRGGSMTMPGSRSALWRFLERHDISFKKKPARG